MKVLVVDDEPLVRRVLLRAFGGGGNEVREAADGSLGLKEWKTFKPDLVILDVLMPGLTGPEVLKEISKTGHRSKVVLVSAYTGDYDVQKARSIGADLFIPKPFDSISEFVRRCEELLP